MSDSREELVHRAFAAFAARDLPALVELVDPQVELRPLVSVWQRTYRGLDGVEDWFEEVAKVWDEFAIEPDEISPLDDERMLVKAHWRGRSIEGGSEVGGPSVGVVAFSGDRVALADFYLNEETALASLEG